MIAEKNSMQKRILALDVGDRTCGVAMSDAMGITAQPVATLRYKNPQERHQVFSDLLQLIRTQNVGTVVVGMPINMNGSAGPQSVKVKEFVTALTKFVMNGAKSEVEWIYWDERLSTSGADKALIAANVSRAKRKEVIDKMAAVFILQGYLRRGETASFDEDSED